MTLLLQGGTQPLPSWAPLLVSALTGGLMAALVTILYNRHATGQASRAKEHGTVQALAGELRRARLLCDHNAALRPNDTAPFIRFPSLVSNEASFGQRHSYPSLSSLQPRIEEYALGAAHLNQLMDLHHCSVEFARVRIRRHQRGYGSQGRAPFPSLRHLLRQEAFGGASCRRNSKLARFHRQARHRRLFRDQ